MPRIEDGVRRAVQQAVGHLLGRIGREHRAQVLDGLLGGVVGDVRSIAEGCRDVVEHFQEARRVVCGLGREVRATEHREQLGSEEDAHGPTTVAIGRYDVGHVHLVDVGPALPVDLDGHEALVECMTWHQWHEA